MVVREPPVRPGRNDGANPTSSFCEADSFCIKGMALLLVTMIVGPGVLGPDDLGGDAEGAVEVLGLRFGGCGLADAQHGPVVGWQDNGADLMALEGVAPPARHSKAWMPWP